MTLETVLFGLGIGLVAFLAWRETRIRRVSQLKKQVRGLKKQIEGLETVVSSLPTTLVIEEALDQLAVLKKELEKSPSMDLKKLVGRMNELTVDVQAVKTEHQALKNDLAAVKEVSPWAKMASRRQGDGG